MNYFRDLYFFGGCVPLITKKKPGLARRLSSRSTPAVGEES